MQTHLNNYHGLWWFQADICGICMCEAEIFVSCGNDSVINIPNAKFSGGLCFPGTQRSNQTHLRFFCNRSKKVTALEMFRSERWRGQIFFYEMKASIDIFDLFFPLSHYGPLKDSMGTKKAELFYLVLNPLAPVLSSIIAQPHFSSHPSSLCQAHSSHPSKTQVTTCKIHHLSIISNRPYLIKEARASYFLPNIFAQQIDEEFLPQKRHSEVSS